jgi:DNA-binding MarR family transcriptional regulator
MTTATTSSRRAAAPESAITEATDLFIALGAVMKRLRRTSIPDDDRLRAALTRSSPAPRHIAALLHVAGEGPIGMSELAERLGVSLATASQVVGELDEWGLVERKTDATDRRRTLVTVAAEHRPVTRALLDTRLKPLQRTLRRLAPQERSALVRGLSVLAEELDQAKLDHAKKESIR